MPYTVSEVEEVVYMAGTLPRVRAYLRLASGKSRGHLTREWGHVSRSRAGETTGERQPIGIVTSKIVSNLL